MRRVPRLRKASNVPNGLSRHGKRSFVTRKETDLNSSAHPSAPNRPPFETVAGLFAASLDKLKDFLSKFPTEEQKHHL